MSLKALLKRNKHAYSLIKKARKIQYIYITYVRIRCEFSFKKTLRVLRINQTSPYENLKTIKKKHEGERCFIIATGPSLTINDLEKLSGETTFSMNSICLAFDKTNWRPTYYGIQDPRVYGRMKKYIDELNVEGKFVSDNILKCYNITNFEDYYIFPLHFLHHLLPNNHNYQTKFSGNAFATIFNGHTITYSLLQLAVYMGFKEIYLLGADCNYGSDMKHHFIDYDIVDSSFALAHDMMTASYKVAKKYADKHNINIYNATRGGKLEVFERVNLDKVLEEEQHVVSAL